MTKNLARLRFLWGITTVLTLTAALIGVIKPAIYDTVMSGEFVPAAFAQDILTVLLYVILLLLIITTLIVATDTRSSPRRCAISERDTPGGRSSFRWRDNSKSRVLPSRLFSSLFWIMNGPRNRPPVSTSMPARR